MRAGRLEMWARVAGLLLLAASAQFLFCLVGGLMAVLAAVPLGIAVAWLWMRFELFESMPWMAVPSAALASAVAVAVVETLARHSFAAWFSPFAAAVACAASLALMLRSRARCGLCSRRLAAGEVSFRCPRCGLQVCDETCWSFEHRRCRLCLEQRVPVLPIQESWWTRVTGPRARQGRCQICLGAADAVDLRGCPQCRRPQCRDCWDFNNAECARCGTVLPDLPPSLTMAVAHVSEQGSSGL